MNGKGQVRTVLQIAGMTCDGCGGRVSAALEAVPGVEVAAADWARGRAEVRHEHGIPEKELANAVKAAAYGTAHRYRTTGVESAGGSGSGWRLAIVPLLICVPCLVVPLIAVLGTAGLSAVIAFAAATWVGLMPAIVLGLVLGLASWTILRRRRTRRKEVTR